MQILVSLLVTTFITFASCLLHCKSLPQIYSNIIGFTLHGFPEQDSLRPARIPRKSHNFRIKIFASSFCTLPASAMQTASNTLLQHEKNRYFQFGPWRCLADPEPTACMNCQSGPLWKNLYLPRILSVECHKWTNHRSLHVFLAPTRKSPNCQQTFQGKWGKKTIHKNFHRLIQHLPHNTVKLSPAQLANHIFTKSIGELTCSHRDIHACIQTYTVEIWGIELSGATEIDSNGLQLLMPVTTKPRSKGIPNLTWESTSFIKPYQLHDMVARVQLHVKRVNVRFV